MSMVEHEYEFADEIPPRRPLWKKIKKVGAQVIAAGQFLAVISTASGIVYGVIAFERESRSREQERISSAWSVVSDTSTEGQANLGLTEALQQLNERKVDLGHARLSKTYLSKLNLPRAKMDGANLNEAILEQSNLCGASLSQASFRGANLNAADLRGTQLDGANLSGARLQGANLGPLLPEKGQRAKPVTANLRGANLEGADLSGADLHNADLRAARLSGAILFRANLEGADLGFADLRKANLGAARLTGANLGGAILSEANLRGASLVGAILLAAQLDNAKLAQADFAGAHGIPPEINLSGACTDPASGAPTSPQTPSATSAGQWCGPPQLTVSKADPRPQMMRAADARGAPCAR